MNLLRIIDLFISNLITDILTHNKLGYDEQLG